MNISWLVDAAVTLYICVWEVLSRVTPYPGQGSSYSSAPSEKRKDATSIRPRPLTSISFATGHSKTILIFDFMQTRYRRCREVNHTTHSLNLRTRNTHLLAAYYLLGCGHTNWLKSTDSPRCCNIRKALSFTQFDWCIVTGVLTN
jgi:hypothetical protein